VKPRPSRGTFCIYYVLEILLQRGVAYPGSSPPIPVLTKYCQYSLQSGTEISTSPRKKGLNGNPIKILLILLNKVCQ